MFDYLSAMGIPVWKERLVESWFLKPLNTVNNPQYAILVGSDETIISPEGKLLLKNLLQAIGWPMSACVFLQWTQKATNHSLVNIKASLSFGSAPLKLPNLCELPTLSDLLSQPNQKKKAWQQLKMWNKR